MKSRAAQTLSRTGTVLRRQLWIWPIVGILVLSLLGYFVNRSISTTMQASVKSELETLLTVESAMLENWFAIQKSTIQTIGNNLQVRESVEKLLSFTQSEDLSIVRNDIASSRLEVHRTITSMIDHRQHQGYLVSDRNHRIIASSNDELVGKEHIGQYNDFIAKALDGSATVSPPFASIIPIKDNTGAQRAGRPTMFVAAPIRDKTLQIVGVLAVRLAPEREFTKILQIGRVGESGQTFAFNRQGLMVSNSRFDHDLILAGLIADQPDSQSILNLQLRDPGVNMVLGNRTKKRRNELPMTKMAESATSGNSGTDIDGYNDYRGVPVVGTWKWLPEYDIGIATEIDYAEAYRPLTILSRVFWGLYVLLFATSVAIFVFSLVVNRMTREAQKAAIEAKELGQYRLEQKLGAGAMGTVYKGYHAMMRRPTAIKLLNVDVMSDTAIKRFEHEVQITSQLNHPNTISIFDYGRTPEGIFYYAMEFLDGIDLQQLVDEYGAQPESRVIHILMQVCGSLHEAHIQGLVHRDIKPANLMLNRRGGQPDVVKVLDFGLVKQVDSSSEGGGLAGTPLYMSPEAIQSPTLVDAGSDLYSIGAVAYFLITGKNIFDATTVVELLQKHLTEQPIPPSDRAHITVSHDLENIILQCLEKSRSKRPQSARDIAQMLARCPGAKDWDQLDAESWWNKHDRRRRGGGADESREDGLAKSGPPSTPTIAEINASRPVANPNSIVNSVDQTIDLPTS